MARWTAESFACHSFLTILRGVKTLHISELLEANTSLADGHLPRTYSYSKQHARFHILWRRGPLGLTLTVTRDIRTDIAIRHEIRSTRIRMCMYVRPRYRL